MSESDHSAGVWAVRMAASDAARRSGAPAIEPAHVLMALCEICDWGPGLTESVEPAFGAELNAEIAELRVRFATAPIDPASLRRRIRNRLDLGDHGGRRDEHIEDMLHRGPAVLEAFDRAEQLAAADAGPGGAVPVTSLHLLRAVLESPVPQWSVPARGLGVPDMLAACFPPERPRRRSSSDAASPARVELEILTGSAAGRRVGTDEPTRWVVGRASDCHLIVPADDDGLVSRHHALVEVDPPHARVRDLGSRNGLRVNGRVVPPPSGDRDGADLGDGGDGPAHRDVVDGDVLQLGETRIRMTARPAAVPAVDGPRGPEGTRIAEDGADRWTRPTSPPSGPRAPHPVGAGATPPGGPSGTALLHRCPVCGDRFGWGDPFGEVPELCEACSADPDRIVEVIGRRVEAGERLPGLFGGYYTVVAIVGDGGMGRVFRAVDEQSDIAVCIKVMLPASGESKVVDMFRREADNGRQLQHRHIVRQREHDEWHGVLYLVTDYCDGGDLRDVIRRGGGRLAPSRAIRIAMQALDGLQYAHTETVTVVHADGERRTAVGVVHRDISLGNLLFGGGVLKIGDFGLAKAFTHAGLSGITRTGTAAGKPFYLPRRQVNEFRHVGPEVDVWAVAACLYVMLTEQPPRDFSGTAHPFQVVLERPVIPIRKRDRSVPPALAGVIDAALTEDSDPGFATAQDLRDALEGVLPP